MFTILYSLIFSFHISYKNLGLLNLSFIVSYMVDNVNGTADASLRIYLLALSETYYLIYIICFNNRCLLIFISIVIVLIMHEFDLWQ